MALTEEARSSAAKPRDAVEIDRFGMAIGPTSVGLPFSCTSDTIFLRYLDLIRLVSPNRQEGPIEARSVDIDALAVATGFEPELVNSRLARLQG